MEWIDWNGTPHPHRYRDWGTAERMAPVICYNSPTVLKEVSRLVSQVVAPPIKKGLARLKKEGKGHLLSGLTVGAEPSLPNYEKIDQINPRIARLMDKDGSPRARLGYNALTNRGTNRRRISVGRWRRLTRRISPTGPRNCPRQGFQPGRCIRILPRARAPSARRWWDSPMRP